MGKLEEEQALLDMLHSDEALWPPGFSEQLFKKFNELLRTDRLFIVGNKKVKQEVLGGYITPLGRALAKHLSAVVAHHERFFTRIRHIDFDDTVTWKDARRFRVVVGIFLFRKKYERAKARFGQKK